MITKEGGARNFPQCKGWETAIKGLAYFDPTTTGNVTLGLKALGAVENTFKCASFCSSSVFYTFSNVANGPPFQNCTTAISDYAENHFPGYALRFILLSLALLAGIVGTGLITFSKQGELEYGRFSNEKRFITGEKSDAVHIHHA